MWVFRGIDQHGTPERDPVRLCDHNGNLRARAYGVMSGSVHSACAAVREQYLCLLLSHITGKLHLLARRNDVGAKVTHRDSRCCKTDRRGVSETHQSHCRTHESVLVFSMSFIIPFFILRKASAVQKPVDPRSRLRQAGLCVSTPAHDDAVAPEGLAASRLVALTPSFC